MSSRVRLCNLLAIALLVGCSRSEDWPQFGRDGSRNAVSSERNPPLDWTIGDPTEKPPIPSKNVRWSIPIDSVSTGLVDPVVVDGMIWISTRQRIGGGPVIGLGRDVVQLDCFDEKTGSLLYRYESARHPAGRVIDYPGSGMNCSPLVEGDRL